jgi:hypothetical protein
VCDRRELVKTPAKKVTDANRQCEIYQSQHSQVFTDFSAASIFVQGFGLAGIGANRKRMISFVKHVRHPRLSLGLNFVRPKK